MSLTPPVVILADGTFPTHHRPLKVLHEAGTLVCCDGAANRFLEEPRKPDFVVGDLDSISNEARTAFDDQLVELPSEQSSDLEKALQFVAEKGTDEVTILGAMGQRDDHVFGNLLMLWANFSMGVTLLTDEGRFTLVRTNREFDSFKGQNVSLFPESGEVRLGTVGLKYPLHQDVLPALYKGTSNCSLGKTFAVEVRGGAVLVYQSYPPEE
jgi:thiamine pyrophosphokinase